MDKCTDGMDKCRKCIALGLPSPTDYGMGGWCKALLKPAVKARDDCHLTTSDMEAIKAAIAGEGRLVCIQGDELPKMQDFFREGFSDGYKKGAEDGINQLKTFVEGLLERQDQGGE